MERNYLMKTNDYRIDNWVRNTFSVAEEVVLFIYTFSYAHYSDESYSIFLQKPTTLPRPEKWYQTVKYWNSKRKGFAVECEIGDESVSEGIKVSFLAIY